MGAIKERSQKATQLAVERLFDKGGTFTAFEIMETLPGTSERYVRTVLTRLQDKGCIESFREGGTGLMCYRKASSAKPFLLGLVCQRRLDAGVAV